MNFAVGQDFKNKRETMKANLENRFSDLARYLDKHEGRYFIDDTPRACDFAVFHHLDLSRKLDGKIIKDFPRLEKFLDDIASLSSIESYLSERPELIDVSIEPKLVINGKVHPTGTVKT